MLVACMTTAEEGHQDCSCTGGSDGTLFPSTGYQRNPHPHQALRMYPPVCMFGVRARRAHVHGFAMLQKITNKIDREIEIGKQWRVGGIETQAKGKRQMVCKYRAHQRLISTGDVWHSP